MTYPKQVNIRAYPGGCLWQCYHVDNEVEERIIVLNAHSHAFFVDITQTCDCEESTPGWRQTPDWQKCLDLYYGRTNEICSQVSPQTGPSA